MEDSLLWEGPRAGAGKECEEGAGERTWDEVTPFPIPLCCFGGGWGREEVENL